MSTTILELAVLHKLDPDQNADKIWGVALLDTLGADDYDLVQFNGRRGVKPTSRHNYRRIGGCDYSDSGRRRGYSLLINVLVRDKYNEGYELVTVEPEPGYLGPLPSFLKSLGRFLPDEQSLPLSRMTWLCTDERASQNDRATRAAVTTTPPPPPMDKRALIKDKQVSWRQDAAAKAWVTILARKAQQQSARDTAHTWIGDDAEIYSLCSVCKLRRDNAIHRGGSPPDTTTQSQSQHTDTTANPSRPSDPPAPINASLPAIERRQRTIRFE